MAKPKKINRLNDALVKYIFASEERKDILLSLINSVLAQAQTPLLLDIEFLNRELNVAVGVPEIAKALDAEEEFMNNVELLYAYDTAEKDRRDAVAHEAYWRNKGFQDGEKNGILKDRIGIIANMMRKGISAEAISDMTGISLGEVRTLSTQIQ